MAQAKALVRSRRSSLGNPMALTMEYHRRKNATMQKGIEMSVDNPAQAYLTIEPIQNPNDSNRRKSLRELIHDGKVIFFDDWIEETYRKDHIRFMGEPCEEEQEEMLIAYNRATRQLSNERTFEEEEESFPEKALYRSRGTAKKREEKTLDDLSDIEELPPLIPKKHPLTKYAHISDPLPTLFPERLPKKKLHPRDSLVPFKRMHSYAVEIEESTRFPLLQLGMRRELYKGWKRFVKIELQFRHLPPPRGPLPDKLVVTEEDLKKMREKTEVVAKVAPKIEVHHRERKSKETRMLAGGRYAL